MVNDRVVLCMFAPSSINLGDYSFAFKYKVPENMTMQWPASFHMKKNVPDRGFLKLHIKYKITARLEATGNNN